MIQHQGHHTKILGGSQLRCHLYNHDEESLHEGKQRIKRLHGNSYSVYAWDGGTEGTVGLERRHRGYCWLGTEAQRVLLAWNRGTEGTGTEAQRVLERRHRGYWNGGTEGTVGLEQRHRGYWNGGTEGTRTEAQRVLERRHRGYWNGGTEGTGTEAQRVLERRHRCLILQDGMKVMNLHNYSVGNYTYKLDSLSSQQYSLYFHPGSKITCRKLVPKPLHLLALRIQHSHWGYNTAGD